MKYVLFLISFEYENVFPAADREDQIIEVPGKNGDKRVTRYDTHSRISLKPTAEDDYAEYTCEARHEALSPDIPLRTTVQLSVFCKQLYFYPTVASN